MAVDLGDLPAFCRYQLMSGDVDPAYPVLSHITAGWEQETRLEMIFLYVAYYDLASALTARVQGATIGPLPESLMRLPTGTERRGLRGGEPLNQHLRSLQDRVDNFGSLSNWLTEALVGATDSRQRWRVLQSTLRSIHGNGRWAAYKTGELLKVVGGMDLEPTDAGHDFSTGPREGLALFYPSIPTGNGVEEVRELNQRTEELRTGPGMPTMPVEQVETMLCDWHAVTEGRYYVGHDLDMMLGQIGRAWVTTDIRNVVFKARAACFGAMWLGESQGWPGVRSALNSLYRRERVLDWWTRM